MICGEFALHLTSGFTEAWVAAKRACALNLLAASGYCREIQFGPSHAIPLYSAGNVMAENGARLIIERRAQLPESLTARDVQRKEWAGLADRDAVAAAIELLVAAGTCREALSIPSPTGGRPSIGYIWNPRIAREG